MAVPNPLAFKPAAVTIWTTLVYLALLIPLIIVHETVPTPPSTPSIYSGVNLTEGWHDLAELTKTYHPFNSRNNDDVRKWLLSRIETLTHRSNKSNIVVFDDTISNVSMTQRYKARFDQDTQPKFRGVYFEGNNIMVYIRGKDDPEGNWWESGIRADKTIGKGGVLVNAHFDSVSTGYGATDDGMGVITVLQLIKHFSRLENQPQRGIVALLNNNEEDWLWGARAFGYSPLMPFCHAFLNLEGAGAGGRANVFRATDTEVMHAYKGAEHPLGSVISSDAWSTGAIRSGTDYEIFTEVYGMRGLDMAFYRPRARYHTNQDDARHASRASLWHMLSNSLHTMTELSGDTGDTFNGERADGNRKKVPNGRGSEGVWFDLFGASLALFQLRTMFAWSLAVLIASPLILMIVTYILIRNDKYYLFSSKVAAYEGSILEPVQMGGRKGIFRFPFAFIVAGALVIGSAYLVIKINPFVIYSYEYTVWAMMFSLFYFVYWAMMAGANFTRPSALHRGYVLLWLFIITWAILVATTVFEDRFRIAAGYVFVFLHSSVFLCTLVTLCELFALPSKSSFAQKTHDAHEEYEHRNVGPSDENLIAASPIGEEGADDIEEGEEEERQPSENTPLIGETSSENRTTTFGTAYRRSVAAGADKTKSDQSENEPFGFEQKWSTSLPSWLWFLQFLLLGPFFMIIIGQAGLELVASVKETGSDGSSLLLPYLLVASFSILMLLPTTPFMHRVSHQVPLLLLLVFIATLIFNLAAFPFSPDSRYKVYFQQTLDLDNKTSSVNYMGVQEYVRATISELPSAMGKKVDCKNSIPDRPDMGFCSYDGSATVPEIDQNWVSINITALKGSKKSRIVVDGKETRNCGLRFNEPISSFKVLGGSARDDIFGEGPDDGGISSILLYRRDWKKPWTVDVQWTNSSRLAGQVYCNYDDAEAIPAYVDGIRYAPTWVGLTKYTYGLLEASKAFEA